ncbi:MAG: DCC1-like thiol-disulfide oxidoreductase family protein [Methylococcales bacterium]|nr:DCC1-like thiol-disulfide oxidoreductase family protein [Methylococcales bacterium]
MYKLLFSKLLKTHQTNAPASGIGLFRLLFGLVTLQEILFLLYFNHLIFDPIPYIDVEFPMIPFFLCLWAIIASFIIIGYRCQFSIITNYIFWVIFVHFTPMQRDFDGGFDLFMIGANFFLIFMPLDKAFAIDSLRQKLQTPFVHYSNYKKPVVSALAYYLPIIICLGFLYVDSAIHKLFAEHWRNGLGAWLPSSLPYYVSALNMSWLLNIEWLQKTIGYTILVFQFSFIFLFSFKKLRLLYFLIGFGLHFGITLSFNIYPFGLGMLIFYVLVLPFSYYRHIAEWLQSKQPSLQVFYDEQCPLCNRTILILNHFDLLNTIDFKGAQSFAAHCSALDSIDSKTLLTDLYAVDNNNQRYAGVATYAQIFIHMRYLCGLGYLLKQPHVFKIAHKKYRQIADSRLRVRCDETCEIPLTTITPMLYDRLFSVDDLRLLKKRLRVVTKVLIILFILQLNSSIHYGLLYRFNVDLKKSPITHTLAGISNSLIMISQSFVGITPHALYLHDHFEGYNHILAITYLDEKGNEHWLPFVTPEGRLAAPNWGRVHSMWANIAITPNIDRQRLHKFIMKVTAFWGVKSELELNTVVFNLKLKKIQAPSIWVKNLLNNNLSGKWKTIGTAKWHQGEIKITAPKDINSL